MDCEQLNKIPLFQGLNDPSLSVIIDLCQEKPVKAGEVIFDEGSSGTELYIVKKGRISIEFGLDQEDRTECIAYVNEMEVFGELALIDGYKRSARCIALLNSELWVLERERFFSFMRSNPETGMKIMENFSCILARKLRDTNLALRNSLRQHQQLFGTIFPT